MISRIACPNCGYVNSSHEEVCKQCRAELRMSTPEAAQSCANCGEENPGQASFCMNCGQALGPPESAPAAAGSASTSSGKGGLWVIALIALVTVGFAIFSSGSGAADEAATPIPLQFRTAGDSCTIGQYAVETRPIIDELSRIANSLNLGDPESRADTSIGLSRLKTRIADVHCADTFPLQHERLESSVTHLMDALRYANAGEYPDMLRSLNFALFNLETYTEWIVGVAP